MRVDTNLNDAANVGAFDSSNVIRQKSFEFDLAYKFRILRPVVPVKTVFYPTIIEDKESGGRKQGIRAFRVPIDYPTLNWRKEPTILDNIKDIDLKIRQESRPVGVTDEVKSVFSPNSKWIFPVLDRRDKNPVIRFLEVGWQIFKKIRDLEEKLDEDDTKKLSHGPIWVHDIVIKKKKKSEKGNVPDRFNVEYEVYPAKDNPLAGKIDAEIRQDAKRLKSAFEASVAKGIFTEEEFAVLKMWDDQTEFIDKYKPMDGNEIVQGLVEFPICCDALDSQSQMSIFPDKVRFAKELMKLGVEVANLIESKKQQKGLPQETFAGASKNAEVKTPQNTQQNDNDADIPF